MIAVLAEMALSLVLILALALVSLVVGSCHLCHGWHDPARTACPRPPKGPSP